MNNHTAYPLCWPSGWPTTEKHAREHGRFKTTLSSALSNLKYEVGKLSGKLSGKNLVLSSNCTLGDARPSNPGVVAYFVLDGSSIAVPCDRWSCVEHNVQAIALTIEAMRGMERWGAKHMIKAMFTGFRALPAPNTTAGIDPWQTLGVRPGASADEVTAAYREKAKRAHPDAGGTDEKFRVLKEAHDMIVNNHQ